MSSPVLDSAVQEFEDWVSKAGDNSEGSLALVVLLQSKVQPDGDIALDVLLAGEYELTVRCPAERTVLASSTPSVTSEQRPVVCSRLSSAAGFHEGCPDKHQTPFTLYSPSNSNLLKGLCQAVNKLEPCKTLSEFLALTVATYNKLGLDGKSAFNTSGTTSSGGVPGDTDDGDDDDDDDHGDADFDYFSSNDEKFASDNIASDNSDTQMDWQPSGDDSVFNIDHGMEEYHLQKRWKRKIESIAQCAAYKSTSDQRGKAGQIFTDTAAFGVLSNDLLEIMRSPEENGIYAQAVEDNIFNWVVRFTHFEPGSGIDEDLKQLKAQSNYDHIEVHLIFFKDLYPFYPPTLSLTKPKLLGGAALRICCTPFLKLQYWSPTMPMLSKLGVLKTVLQDFARVDVTGSISTRSVSAYSELESNLLRLSMIADISVVMEMMDVDISNLCSSHRLDALSASQPVVQSRALSSSVAKLKAKPGVASAFKNKSRSSKLPAGTGYGCSMAPEGWDQTSYQAAQEERQNQLEAAIRAIYSSLDQTDSQQQRQEKALQIQSSVLIPFMVSNMDPSTNLLEIARQASLISAQMDLIAFFVKYKEFSTFLYRPNGARHSIAECLEVFGQLVSAYSKRMKSTKASSTITESRSAFEYDEERGSDNWDLSFGKTTQMRRTATRKVPDPEEPDLLYSQIADVARAVKAGKPAVDQDLPCPKCVSESISTGPAPLAAAAEKTTATPGNEELYCKIMAPMQLDSLEEGDATLQKHHYANNLSAKPGGASVQRIVSEMVSLSDSLPMDYSSSVYVRTYEDDVSSLKALIVGPDGTPYAGGCFEFDIRMPGKYPHVPPKVNLMTTGRNTFRFNPNLYQCGKVCLSLLGTWSGNKGENWDARTSNLRQVLVSIMSLILIPEPYFNEPGFESSYGSHPATAASKQYNTNVRKHCVRLAILGHLKNPPPAFKEVIQAHFYLKKDAILAECHADGFHRSDTMSELKKYLNALPAPPGASSPSASAGASVTSG